MHHARRLTLLSLALALAVTGLAGLSAPPGAARQPDADQPRILVLGDSISAKSYYGRDSNGKGWWGHLAEDTGAALIMSVENGSGFLRQGEHCRGTTYGERLAALNVARADYVIVEGGVNDLFFCTGRDTMLRAKGRHLRERIPAFMSQLAAAADAAGIPRSHLYVFTPWGTDRPAQRERIHQVVRQSTRRIGAQYVDVPAFTPRLTKDGIHPTRRGSRFLYRKLTRGSTLLSDVASG